MVNNFYVGVVFHRGGPTKAEYSDKLVLYSDDNVNFLDLLSGKLYTTDVSSSDYVIEESLISTDVSQYRENYIYMLDRYKENSNVRKKIFNR